MRLVMTLKSLGQLPFSTTEGHTCDSLDKGSLLSANRSLGPIPRKCSKAVQRLLRGNVGIALHDSIEPVGITTLWGCAGRASCARPFVQTNRSGSNGETIAVLACHHHPGFPQCGHGRRTTRRHSTEPVALISRRQWRQWPPCRLLGSCRSSATNSRHSSQPATWSGSSM